MIVQLFIAKRYLFGKKSKNIINLVSAISVCVVAVVTMALFVALSIFNGLNELVTSSYNNFDPDLKIVPKEGKYFESDSLVNFLSAMEDIKAVTEVVEEDVMLKFKEKQFIGKIKGVNSNFCQINNIKQSIYDGEYLFERGGVDYALFGQSIAFKLGIGTHYIDPVYIYAPRRNASVTASPDKAYRKKHVYASAIFSTNQEIDEKYLITSIELARSLLDYKNEANYLEISLTNPEKTDYIENKLNDLLGEKFEIKNRFEQHAFLYKIMMSEKWAIFLIVSFILAIASFNIIGSLSMLIIDKKEDIKILKSLGASVQTIKQIFLFEGWMISLLGAIIGLVLGLILCWAQIKFSLLELQGSGSFVVSAYPIKIIVSDIFLVLAMVLFIGFWTAYYPVQQISKKHIV